MTNTRTITATTTDGETIEIIVPTDLPSDERFDYLQRLWNEHVEAIDGHWKGPVRARVAAELADDVAEAMGNNGAHVDARAELADTGEVQLYSRGYWAHGY